MGWHMTLLSPFCSKIDSKRSFCRLFLNIGNFEKKMDNVIRFSVTKIDIPSYFMLSQSKRHKKAERRNFRLKNHGKLFPKAPFCLFSPLSFLRKKKHFFHTKMKNVFKFSIMKIGNFVCLQLKIISKICQKVVNIDLRTALKHKTSNSK